MTFIDAGVSAVGRLRRGLARMTNLAGSDPTSNLANSAAPLVELNGREHVGDIRREATLARWKATVDAGEAGLADHSDTIAKILAEELIRRIAAMTPAMSSRLTMPRM